MKTEISCDRIDWVLQQCWWADRSLPETPLKKVAKINVSLASAPAPEQYRTELQNTAIK